MTPRPRIGSSAQRVQQTCRGDATAANRIVRAHGSAASAGTDTAVFFNCGGDVSVYDAKTKQLVAWTTGHGAIPVNRSVWATPPGSLLVDGLLPETEYSVYCSVKNAFGWSESSPEVTFETLRAEVVVTGIVTQTERDAEAQKDAVDVCSSSDSSSDSSCAARVTRRVVRCWSDSSSDSSSDASSDSDAPDAPSSSSDDVPLATLMRKPKRAKPNSDASSYSSDDAPLSSLVSNKPS